MHCRLLLVKFLSGACLVKRCASLPPLPTISLQRRRILSDTSLDFDGLLKLCVCLAGRIDLEATLRDALLLCQFAGEAGQECCAALGGGG